MKAVGLAATVAGLAAGLAFARTDVMIFQDTEDYTTPRSDDAVIELANLFAEEGVVGNFDVVGFYAQKLIENRRFDVLDSLKPHTVGSQSLYHSLHPTQCEKAAIEDAREAYRLIHEDESKCFGMLRAAFGFDDKDITYITGPGNSFTYITADVASDLGMRFALDSVPGSTYGMWYMNLLQLPYNYGLERLIPPNPEPDYARLLDEFATRNWLGLSMHPDMIRSTTHWDLINYRTANFCEWRKWTAAPRRPEPDVQEFYRRLRKLIRMIRADRRFRFTDIRELATKIRPRRDLTPADVPALARSLRNEFGPVFEPDSYCVADVFRAAALFLRGENRVTPGKIRGFLARPEGVKEPVTVRTADLRKAAAALDFSWYLPTSIRVGEMSIGPADFLFAALEALETGADTVRIEPREQLGSFDRMGKLETFDYMKWPIHARDLPEKILSDRMRYQLWTLRYERGVAPGAAAEGPALQPLDVQALIDAVPAGGTVSIPSGRWAVKPFRLKGDMTFCLESGATLFASTDLADYSSEEGERTFVSACGADNLTICGSGVLDGRGGAAAFVERGGLKGESQPQALPVMMRFTRCRNLKLEDFTYRCGGAWGCHLRNCDGVGIRRVRCFNHVNDTNDGIDIESSNVIVEDCDIDADDDAVVFKTESDRSFPVTNVVVRNCRLASCCNALKFGTGSYCDFRDIRVENCRFERPAGNFRFDWKRKYADRGARDALVGLGGMALEVADGGRMENVVIRDIRVEGYIVPIFVRLERRHEAADPRGSYLRNVLIENVKGVAAGRNGCSITGVPGLRPSGITLRNVELSFPGGGVPAERDLAVRELKDAYPEGVMFRRNLPAWAFYVRHADGIRFENVNCVLTGTDAREKFVFDDADVQVE